MPRMRRSRQPPPASAAQLYCGGRRARQTVGAPVAHKQSVGATKPVMRLPEARQKTVQGNTDLAREKRTGPGRDLFVANFPGLKLDDIEIIRPDGPEDDRVNETTRMSLALSAFPKSRVALP